MKLGNVTGVVYDRSIHKKLNTTRKEIVNSAVRGEDCAVLAFDEFPGAPGIGNWTENPAGIALAAAQAQTVYYGENCGKYAVFAAVNQAACAGAASPAGVLMHILLPAESREETLRRIVEDAQNASKALNVELADVKANVTGAVISPVVTAAALGVCGLVSKRTEMPMAGREIVMTKWAGLEGSALLAERCAEKLKERYPSYLIEEAADFDRFLSIVPEAAAATKSGVSMLCAAAEGGIFRALWTLAERAGTGLEIDLKKIPIRQETVEICNYLDLNPYELAANGSLLCVTEHGEALVRKLDKIGVLAAIIGTVTANNDRVILNGEERRFLEPAKADEIHKIL